MVYITNVFPTAVWIALLPVDGFTADERFQFIQRAKYIRPNRRTVLGYIEFNPTCSLFLTDSTGHSVFTKFSIRQMQYHKSYLKSVDFPFNHDSLVNGSLGLSELVSHSFNFRITPFNNVSSSHGDDRIPQKFPKSLIQQTFSFQINATAIVSFPELVKSRTIVFRSTDSSDKDFFVYNPTQHSLQVQVIPPLYQSMNSHPLIPSTPFTIISDLAPAIIPPFSQRLMARVRFNSSFVMSNSSKHVNGWFSDIFTLRNNLSFPIAINLKGRLFSPRINFIDPSNYLIVSKIEINLNETMPSCFDNVGISSSGKTIFIRATSAWNSSKLFSCFPSFSKTLLMSNRGDATLNVSRITASWVDSKVQDAYEKKTNLTVSQFFPLTLNPGESFPLKFSFQRIASLEEDFLLDLCFSSSVLIEFHVFLGDTKVNCLPLSCSLPKGFKGLVRGLRPVNFVVYFFRFCCVFLLVSSCIAISWDIFLLGIHSFQSSDVKNISIPAYSGLNDLLTFLKKPLLNLEKRLQINSVSHFPRSVSNKHSKKRSKMNLQEDLTLSDFKQKSTMNSSKTAFVPNEPQVSNNLSDYAIDGDTVDNACQLETEVMEDSVEECLISSLQDDRKCIGQHVNQPQSDATESANFLEEKSVCFNKIAVEEINLLPNPVFSESKSSVPELTDQEVKPGEEDRSQNGRRSHSFSSVMGVKKDLSPSKLDRSYSLGDDVPDPIASVVNSLFDDSSSNYSAIPGSQTSRIFLVQSFRSHPDISSVESTRKSPQSNTSTWGFPSSVSVCNSNFSVPNTMLPCLDSTTNYDQFRSLNSFGGNSSCGPSPYRRFSRSGDIYVHNRSNDFGIIGQSRRTHSIFPRQLEIVDDIASTSHHLNLGSVVHNAPRPSSPPPHSYVRNFTEFKN